MSEAGPQNDTSPSEGAEDTAPRGPALPKPGRKQLVPLLEALLFRTGRAVAASTLAKALPGVGEKGVQKALTLLEQQLEDEARGIRLARVAGGYKLVTARLGPHEVRAKLDEDAPVPSSKAHLRFHPARTLLYADGRLVS